jgi:glycosyltransferase involved in cell wall biosynthesis
MRAAIIDLLCNSPFYDAPLVRALRQNGVEAELASPRFYLEPDYLDACPRPRWIIDLTVRFSRPRAIRLASRTVEISLNLLRLLHAIRKGEYQVVHVEWIPLEARQTVIMRMLRAACDHAGIPLVLTIHNVLPHDTPAAKREVIRRNLDLADLLVVHTNHVVRELESLLGVKKPMAIVPHGVMFADAELLEKAEAKSALGLEGDPLVLFAGVVRPYKGADLLAEAWPTIREVFPGALLLVVGHALGDEARSQLSELEKLPGVRVTGSYVSVKTMVRYHAACDLVVFPYKSIWQSGALMSAVGLGRPSVVTPIPGFVDQAAGLGSVVFADAATGPAIAKATIAALEAKPVHLAAAAEDRRRVATSTLGWPSVGKATARAYERAIAGPRQV